MRRKFLIDIQQSAHELSQKVIRSAHGRTYSRLSFFPRHGFDKSLYVCVFNHDWCGYDYIERAIAEGAYGIVLEETHEHLASGIPQNIDVYIIENHRTFLERMACHARSLYQGDVLAITGSTGKTRTCEILYALLKTKHIVHFNSGNRNGFFGICELLINLTRDCNFVLAEVGAKIHGELSALGQILRPQFVAITNIQHSHLKTLHSHEGVQKLKHELLQGDWVSTAFLNTKCALSLQASGYFPSKKNVIQFNQINTLDVMDQSCVRTIANNLNILDEEVLAEAVKKPPAFGRQLVTLATGQTVLIDGRVSTPESLESLRQFALQQNITPMLIILSGAIELGEHEAYFTSEAALLWSTLKAEKIYYIGPSPDTFITSYRDANGTATIFSNEPNAEEISKAIFSLPSNAHVIVQGNLKIWLYELWRELGLN